MKDLIVFNVGTNRYAMDIENIQRIIQSCDLTSIPNRHEFVDGMMSHEGNVIKVMSFRKLIGLQTYEDELRELFVKLKAGHQEWMESLKESIYEGRKFTKTIDPHMCELGKWLDNFTSFDDRVSVVLSELVENHKLLHLNGAEICELNESKPDEAKKMFDVEISSVFSATMSALDTFVLELDIVANSLQKLLIYEKDNKKFAIKVDTIEDIAHVEEANIMASDSQAESTDFLKLDGVLDLNDVLINVIKTIKLAS